MKTTAPQSITMNTHTPKGNKWQAQHNSCDFVRYFPTKRTALYYVTLAAIDATISRITTNTTNTPNQ